MSQSPTSPDAAPDALFLLAHVRLELARMPAAVDALVAGLDDTAARTRPAPEEWSPVEILCHLRDEETEDFGARLAVIAEGGSGFAPIDPERWARERNYREAALADAEGAWRARRRATLQRLAAMAPEAAAGSRALGRSGTLSGFDVLAAWVAHDRLHLAQLASTVARLWADRWATLRVDYAGPIPYPRA
jgi:DinB family protein